MIVSAPSVNVEEESFIDATKEFDHTEKFLS
jgi:hypothetical protein